MWLSVMRRGQGEYFFLDSPPLLAVRPAYAKDISISIFCYTYRYYKVRWTLGLST